MKKHRVTIRWGEDPDFHDFETYEFDTEGEAKAFRLGIEECCGWLDYEEIEEDDA